MTPSEQAMLEEAIREVGSFGEVSLVIERGRLAFIRKTKSLAVRDPRQGELELK